MTATHQPSTKQDILHYLAKQGQASSQHIAEHFDISPRPSAATSKTFLKKDW